MIKVKISTWGSPNLQYLDMGSRVKKVGKPWHRRTSLEPYLQKCQLKFHTSFINVSILDYFDFKSNSIDKKLLDH